MRRCIFFCLFTLSIFASSATYTEVEDLNKLMIKNPALSDRKSAKIKLENGLSIYIVSDKNIDKSAAALCVNVGSWNDPKKYPGMAHFLEHMLFQGSITYPGESAFMNFIWEHNGTPNAYTAPDRTVYAFSMTNDAFIEGLDRFSHFFIDPILPPSGIARELHAVDQEHAKNVENDGWRKYRISKETGNPDHPNFGYGCGNANTLSNIPQEKLKQWFEKNYSPNIMSLFVYSPLNLEVLKKEVIAQFSKIPNRHTKSLALNIPLSSDMQKNNLIYIEPVKDLQILTVAWELPSNTILDSSKSAQLISYALTRGNLLQSLKNLKFADDLDVEVETIGNLAAMLEINIQLTDEGIANVNKVIKQCFEAIASLKTTGIPSYLFDEMKGMKIINYEYQSREDAFAFAQENAAGLADEDLSTYPQKSLIPTKYNPKKIHALLKTLTIKDSLLSLLAKPEKTNVPMEKQEQWLGGKYTLKKISSSQLALFKNTDKNSFFQMPKPNAYIPTDLKLLSFHKLQGSLEKPLKFFDGENGKSFYARDTDYKTPQTAAFFKVQSPYLNGTAKAAVMMDLYMKSFKEDQAPLLLLGNSAGLTFDISLNNFHLDISFYGYSEKLPFYLQQVVKTFKSHMPTEEEFAVHKVFLKKYYQNSKKDLPYVQAVTLMNNLLTTDNPSNEVKFQEIENLTYEEFALFQKTLFSKTYTEAFFCGNLSLKDSESIWIDVNHIFGPFSFPKEDHYQRKVLSLTDKEGPFMIEKNTSVQGNAAILMIDQGPFSFKNRAAQQILSNALKADFFAALRTKQKTAYIAKAWDQELEKNLKQYFAVQSSTHQPLDLMYRFGQFTDDFAQDLSCEISKDRFDTIQKSLITSLKTPQKNLLEKSALLANLAFNYEEDFAWLSKRIEGFESLSYEEFISKGKDFLSRNNKKRIAILYSGKLPQEKEFRYQQITCDQITDIGSYLSPLKKTKGEIVENIEK